jgi:hypothetical protein
MILEEDGELVSISEDEEDEWDIIEDRWRRGESNPDTWYWGTIYDVSRTTLINTTLLKNDW